ncbi:TenA family protein [Pacificibacter marinus]|uniref:TenA family protein n=1 Tax=Pacificibacter marinus TaxID=658057 RepID=UPI001C07C56C|nr:TenA family protein [Pacificibacter marinus]MBU2866399.1 TenA family protein [Pacificibacter marinus]
MSFTQDLWTMTSDLQDAIRTMPFNTELAQGTLPSETFREYIIQDAHYLEGFARALALAASRAPDADTIARLAGSASGAIAVERQLHSEYMVLYGVSPADFAATPPSCACDHYVNFLIRAAAVDPFPVAVASLLPCFWIYQRVGAAIHAQAAANHPYRAWIDTYASDAFEASVQGMLDLTDVLGKAADISTRTAMQKAFAAASWHEWTFWDSAYHRKGWVSPINGDGAKPHTSA